MSTFLTFLKLTHGTHGYSVSTTHIAREKFLSSYMGTHVYYWENKDCIVLYCINKFQHKLLNDWFTV